MSATAIGTQDQSLQFQHAYEAYWLDRDGRLQVDDPKVRAGLIKALDAYTAAWRKRCTPPESTSWAASDNNKAFVAQTIVTTLVVMTLNETLSIPGGLRTTRPDDHHTNAATIDWPGNVFGRVLALEGGILYAVVFKAGGNNALAEELVRFLVEDGWLALWLTFTGDRWLPPMRKLVDQPFWLDTTDPHRLRSAVQFLNRPQERLLPEIRASV